MKNFLTLAILSAGTPMLLMGDEVRRTQLGNSNACCQDNETSWFDWAGLAKHADVHRFTRVLVMLRSKAGPADGQVLRSLNVALRDARIEWHGVELCCPDGSDESHSLAFTAMTPDGRFPVYIVANAYWESLHFALPPAAGLHRGWHRPIDTSLDPPHDICAIDGAPPVAEAAYQVQSRSIVVLWTFRAAASGPGEPRAETSPEPS